MLLLVGGAWPLLALGEPAIATKARFLTPMAGLILAFAGVTYLRNRNTLKELKDYTLWPYVVGRLEQEEQDEEAWDARRKEDEEERRRAAGGEARSL
jgi:hypothetical protein